MLVGLNVALSFFGGSVLAWGVIGPALVHNGIACKFEANGIMSAGQSYKYDKNQQGGD